MSFGRVTPWPKPAMLDGQHLCALCCGWTNWTQCVGPHTRRHVFHCTGCGKPAALEFADMSDRKRREMRCDGVYTASPKIGEFLERRGQFDFSKMSEREWYDFLHKVLDEYELAIREITRKYH